MASPVPPRRHAAARWSLPPPARIARARTSGREADASRHPKTRRMLKKVQMRGGARRPHARRTVCTLSVRPRAPTKQMGLLQHPALAAIEPGQKVANRLVHLGDLVAAREAQDEVPGAGVDPPLEPLGRFLDRPGV